MDRALKQLGFMIAVAVLLLSGSSHAFAIGQGKACGPRIGTCDEGLYCAVKNFKGAGVCVKDDRECNFDDPNRGYLYTDPAFCSPALSILCAEGYRTFFDECGCGCEKINDCKIGGCSGELCVAPGEPDVSICIWREEYACYADAKCERQPDGDCGWTPTVELKECIEKAQSNEPVLN